MPRANWNEIEEAQDYSPIPTGVYHCKLVVVDSSKTTAAGDEMWELKFVVVDGEYRGRKIYDRLSFGRKALPRVKLLFSRMGQKLEGDVNVTPDMIRGRECFVSVEVEEYATDEGVLKQRNTVPFAGFAEITPTPAPTVKADDDLPF